MADEGVREVVVPPRGARTETLWVFGAILLIAALSAARFAFLRPAGSAPAPAAAVLTGSEGLVYQSLLVAVDAVASLREGEGAWPSPERLAKEDMPPFASALLPQDLRGYRWEMRPAGAGVDYVGREPAGRTAFLLRMDRDQPPGATAPRISVQIWIHGGKNAPPPGATPASTGWFRLVELDGPAGPARKAGS